MRDNVSMIQRKMILLEQVSGQLGRGQVFRGVVPLEASGIKTGMLNAYRVLVVPEVARVKGNIFLVYDLIHGAVAIHNILDADAAIDVLEYVECILCRALDIVDDHLQN